jgi:histidyl-tRNA synthetase
VREAMKPKTIRGMNDLLPEVIGTWRYLERIVIQIAESYGFNEIRLPLIERTELFKRSIGADTDIVEKEMYTFKDRNDESITLRPEATASMVRAGITNGLLHNQQQKLWTMGPMFRYEKPQKGRYRQFHQFNLEAMGYKGPDIDAELIIMCARIWKVLNLKNLRLEINSLGNQESRAIYRNKLIAYFSEHKNELDQNSLDRLQSNPLRILDSKNPDMLSIIKTAPIMLDYLDDESKRDFDMLRLLLDNANIKYIVNPRLVRGLDYYNKTVFEWVTDDLGAQGAVCSGGRYDGLVEKLGGRATPAIGWAMGIERLVSLYEISNERVANTVPHIYIVTDGDMALHKGFDLAEELRENFPTLRFKLNMGGGSFKSQLKRADKSQAFYAIIIGTEEMENNQVGFKPLRNNEAQVNVSFEDIVTEVKKIFG